MLEGIKFEFWWGGFNCADRTVHLSDRATTMSLRGPATQHLHNEARRAEFDGTGKTDGTVIKSVL